MNKTTAIEAIVMNVQPKTKEQLLFENEELRSRLIEAEDTLEAIRTGEVDALVVSTAEGEKIFSLQSVDYNYRVMVENMNEGAITLNKEGVVVFCNRAFSAMTGREMEKIVGVSCQELLPRNVQTDFSLFLKDCAACACRKEFTIIGKGGSLMPVAVSGTLFEPGSAQNLCLILSDLTLPKRSQEALEQANLEIRNANEVLEQRVIERTAELTATNDDLTRLNHAMVDRELRMIEMKKQVNELAGKLGHSLPYLVTVENENKRNGDE